jgi:biopolymer transport protein ExbB
MTEILHQITFGLMIATAIIAVVVATERIIFAGMNLRRAKLSLDATYRGQTLETALGRDVVSDMVRLLLDIRSRTLDPAVRQDRADAAYIQTRDALFHRMWILDTVVTAAPLMGLLGTIFGIVDTFLALSRSGMSDPSTVSAGIGTALYATALGISIALVGLLVFNYLNDRNERICEYLKMLILKTSGEAGAV